MPPCLPLGRPAGGWPLMCWCRPAAARCTAAAKKPCTNSARACNDKGSHPASCTLPYWPLLQGCIMMRKCHTNTCPVGIATQVRAGARRFVPRRLPFAAPLPTHCLLCRVSPSIPTQPQRELASRQACHCAAACCRLVNPPHTPSPYAHPTNQSTSNRHPRRTRCCAPSLRASRSTSSTSSSWWPRRCAPTWRVRAAAQPPAARPAGRPFKTQPLLSAASQP